MNLSNMLFAPLSSLFLGLLKLLLLCVVLLLSYFVIRLATSCRGNPFTMTADKLRSPVIKSKFFDLIRWMIIDYKERCFHVGEFLEYGFTFFVGRQGAGKTTAMVEYLNRIHKKFPDCLIVTNFKYEFANFIMVDWQDLLNVRNGTAGVVFAIDEVHSEYSASAWKDVPENMLQEVSQQRKQRIKIVGTTQFFTRVAKPLREQASTVVICSCLFGRMIRTKTYDALEYATFVDNPIIVKKKLKPISKYSFISSDFLRGCFDTYEKINRMRKMEEQNRKAGRV